MSSAHYLLNTLFYKALVLKSWELWELEGERRDTVERRWKLIKKLPLNLKMVGWCWKNYRFPRLTFISWNISFFSCFYWCFLLWRRWRNARKWRNYRKVEASISNADGLARKWKIHLLRWSNSNFSTTLGTDLPGLLASGNHLFTAFLYDMKIFDETDDFCYKYVYLERLMTCFNGY